MSCSILSIPKQWSEGEKVMVWVFKHFNINRPIDIQALIRHKAETLFTISWLNESHKDFDLEQIDTEKLTSYRSILQRKSFFLRRYFKQCKTSILKCLYGIKLLRAFKFTQERFHLSFFFISRILLRSWPEIQYSAYLWVLFAQRFISMTSSSINKSCVLEYITCFGIVSCTKILKNWILELFTIAKHCTKNEVFD